MLINTINGRHRVEFDQGKFDSWCVYLTKEGGPRYAPVDEEYFTFFQTMAARYSAEKVYTDFLKIYMATTTIYNPKIVEGIKRLAATYATDAEETEIWFSVIYGGMIAEENKTGMILKKRIKRLGMHQILVENVPPKLAAKFSVGKKWRELNELMKERGFGI